MMTMLQIDIPGRGRLQLEHLVLDFNGTLAVDGLISAAVCQLLRQLSACLFIQILTADTNGTAAAQCSDLPVRLRLVDQLQGAQDKLRWLQQLGAAKAVALGNGQNDVAMLQAAALGIAVVGAEGAAVAALLAADVVVTSPEQALQLLLHPKRLIATLRS
jgi:soluble P-type ATPase